MRMVSVRKTLSQWLGRAIYAMRGWSFEPTPPDWALRQVVIGFPHRTWFDTVMAFAGFAIIGQRGHVMVKREAFVWPLSILLRSIGAIPVDRAAASGVVEQMAAEFARREVFQLALVPEGTRSGATRIRTGFWHIAKAAQVPIACWYLDNENKRTRWVGRLLPSDDMAADLKLIRQLYADAGLQIAGLAE